MGRIIMKSFTYIFLALLLSNSSFAVEIPNQFEDGQVTSASQMNENFQVLKVEIESLKAQLEALNKTNKVTFVGVTNEQFSGNAGIVTVGQACDSMYKNSYVCGLGTFRDSIKPNDVFLSKEAWIYGACSDFGALASPGSTNITGHFLNTSGEVMQSYCQPGEIYSVACCK